MNGTFRSVVRGRSGDGVLSIIGSTFIVLVALGPMALAFCYGMSLSASAALFLGLVAFAGGVFLVKSVNAYHMSKEWEFHVDAHAMRWFERDSRGERVEGEISLKEVEALVYEETDGLPCLRVQFEDGTRAKIPSLHLDTATKIQEFLAYWRQTHPHLPVRRREIF